MKSLEFKGFTSPTTKGLAALSFPFFSFHHSRLKWWIGVQFLLLSLPQVRPPKLLQIQPPKLLQSGHQHTWFLLGFQLFLTLLWLPSQPAFALQMGSKIFGQLNWASHTHTRSGHYQKSSQPIFFLFLGSVLVEKMGEGKFCHSFGTFPNFFELKSAPPLALFIADFELSKLLKSP